MAKYGLASTIANQVQVLVLHRRDIHPKKALKCTEQDEKGRGVRNFVNLMALVMNSFSLQSGGHKSQGSHGLIWCGAKGSGALPCVTKLHMKDSELQVSGLAARRRLRCPCPARAALRCSACLWFIQSSQAIKGWGGRRRYVSTCLATRLPANFLRGRSMPVSQLCQPTCRPFCTCRFCIQNTSICSILLAPFMT